MASGVANLIFTYSFLKRLVTPFNETDAYKLGIIDERGKKIKSPKTTEELNSYSTFERLVFNIKKNSFTVELLRRSKENKKKSNLNMIKLKEINESGRGRP